MKTKDNTRPPSGVDMAKDKEFPFYHELEEENTRTEITEHSHGRESSSVYAIYKCNTCGWKSKEHYKGDYQYRTKELELAEMKHNISELFKALHK